MKRTKARAVSAVLLTAAAALTLVPAAAAQQEDASYYQDNQIFVAPWGKDNWPGDYHRPFATLARAQKAVRAKTAKMTRDIVVNVRRGDYKLTESLSLSSGAGDSGMNGHQVVYQAFRYGRHDQEPVRFSGGRKIDGWRPAEGRPGVWQAEVGSLETRQLYVNGARAGRAQYAGEGLPGKVEITDFGYVVDTKEPQSWSRPQDIEFSYAEWWLYEGSRCGVESITPNGPTSTAIKMRQPCYDWLRDLFPRMAGEPLEPPVRIENSASFLKPGTWYLDRSKPGRHKLLYQPRPGENPWHTNIVAPVLETFVSGQGQETALLHDVEIKGFAFEHAGWLKPNGPGGYPHIFGNWFYNGGHLDPGEDPQNLDALILPGAVTFKNTDRITFEGNRVEHVGAQGVEFHGNVTNAVIRGNVVNDTSGGGIQVGQFVTETSRNDHNLIENNWVHDIGKEYWGSVGITLDGGNDTVIAHNQVNDTSFTGILTSPPDPPHGLRIINNRIFRTQQMLADGGGIWFPLTQGTSFEDGTLVKGNVVHDIRHSAVADDDPASSAIYSDLEADFATIEGNIAYGSNHAFGGVEPGRMIVKDNFWDDDRPTYWPPDEAHGEDVQMINNTLLNRDDPLGSCRAIPACKAIEANAGIQQQFRYILR